MSEINLSGMLVAAAFFLTGVLLVPGVPVSVGGFWTGSGVARRRLRQVARTAVSLRGRPDQFNSFVPSDIAPLQSVSGAIGFVAGLALSAAFAFPSGGWILILLAGVSGYQLPVLLLRQRLAGRSRAVHRELPEVVGLLRAYPGNNLAMSLTTITRTRRGPLAAAIRQALECNATGIPLLTALQDTTARLQIEEVGRFLDVLAHSQATSARSGDLLCAYEEELLSRRREVALRRVETAESKISAVLTVATAMQLLLLLVVPSLLQFLGPGA